MPRATAAKSSRPVRRAASAKTGEQERVVGEHLLEVRQQPARVRAVAVEAAAELVVDAARGHGLEACAWPCSSRAASPERACSSMQQRERLVRRELGRAAEAAVDGIEVRGELAERLVHQRAGLRSARRRVGWRRGQLALRRDRLHHRLGLVQHFGAARVPDLAHGDQHGLEARPLRAAVLAGEVGAAEPGLARRASARASSASRRAR